MPIIHAFTGGAPMKLALKIVLVVVIVLIVVIGVGGMKVLGPRAFLGPRFETTDLSYLRRHTCTAATRTVSGELDRVPVLSLAA